MLTSKSRMRLSKRGNNLLRGVKAQDDVYNADDDAREFNGIIGGLEITKAEIGGNRAEQEQDIEPKSFAFIKGFHLLFS